jgi:alpha-glucosidase
MLRGMSATAKSPNGNASVSILVDENGALRWSAEWKGKPVLAPSPISLATNHGELKTGFSEVEVRVDSHDEVFPILAGKASEGRDCWNEATLTARHGESGAALAVTIRAFDEGIALRWLLHHPKGAFELLSENIDYCFTSDHPCWALALPNHQTGFEGEYDKITLHSIQSGDRKGLPLLVHAGSCWAAIMEAALENHAGMYLTGRKGSIVTTELSPQLHDPFSTSCVSAASPHASPWRVVLLGDTAGSLIESSLPLALNPPSRIGDTSWIKPGLVAWDWWCGPCAPKQSFKAGMNTQTFEYFVDFCQEYQIPYCMIDGGWYGGTDQGGGEDITRSVPELDVPYVVKYGAERGVGIILWLHSRDLRKDIDRAFAWYKEQGIRGLKIDFFDSCDQETVAFCHEILTKAAQHHLLVNFHGIFTPVGWERTYPNLMTMEGVMGAEYSKWSKRVTPDHNVSLAFTRMLAGPLDYTVGSFLHAVPEEFVPRGTNPITQGTRAHQLALYVIYQSALQMVSDTPDCIRGEVGSEILTRMPAVWDETRFLAGEPDQWAAIARRKGDRWHIAGITGNSCRMITLDLSSFADAGPFTLYRDGETADKNPAHCVVETVSGEDLMNFKAALAPGGGFLLMPA